MKKEARISSRVRGVEISGIRRLFEAAGPGSINMGLGQPDFDTPEHIKSAAIRALAEGRTGYTSNAGIPELKEAISNKLQRENQVSCPPSGIIVTAGASEALHIVMQALLEPGDRVIVTDPGFVSYDALARIAGGVPDGIPLDATMHIDLETAKEKIDGARLLILNSPANPTGAVEPEETIRSLVEYAGDKGVTVVSDEVYEHFIYDTSHVSAARFGEDVITINASSKTYAMTGWRLGFLAGPEEYTSQCLKVHQYCQACASSVAQYAALAAYEGPQEPVRLMRDEYHRRRDLLCSTLRELGFSFPLPEGAFYAFVPMDKPLLEDILSRGVVIVPGDAFGTRAPDYARISYAVSQDQIRVALGRIHAAVDQHPVK